MVRKKGVPILLSPLIQSKASLLRQIVAGPRSRHPEAGLDLCYVTDNSTSPFNGCIPPTKALVH